MNSNCCKGGGVCAPKQHQNLLMNRLGPICLKTLEPYVSVKSIVLVAAEYKQAEKEGNTHEGNKPTAIHHVLAEHLERRHRTLCFDPASRVVW